MQSRQRYESLPTPQLVMLFRNRITEAAGNAAKQLSKLHPDRVALENCLASISKAHQLVQDGQYPEAEFRAQLIRYLTDAG